MATIKSYTDLPQSKVLAKILPLESADMYWWSSGKRYYIEAMDDGDFNEEEGHVRAWSLSALLDVLPVSCDDGQHCLALINSNPNGKTEWLCAYEDNNGNLMMECYADNQIDACVAMIENLHELKML